MSSVQVGHEEPKSKFDRVRRDFNPKLSYICDFSSVDRTSACHAEGRGFESRKSLQYGNLTIRLSYRARGLKRVSAAAD